MDYENLITITVDKNLRTLTVPNNGAVFGVVGDMSVNRICFSVPRYYSCFDMSEFTPRINYANSNGAANYYEADDLKSDENTVKFTWLLSPDVTTYIGNVKFSVQLYKKEANRVVQNFNTCYTNGKVLDGFIAENYVTPEQQETLLDKLAAQVTANIDEYLENSLVGAKDDLKVEADKYQKVITDSEKAMIDFVNSSKNDISKAATETKEEIIKEIASDENVEQINKNATNIDSLKEDFVEVDTRVYSVEDIVGINEGFSETINLPYFLTTSDNTGTVTGENIEIWNIDNIFDKDSIKTGYRYDDSGQEVADPTGAYQTKLVPICPNGYIYHNQSSSFIQRIYTFDKDEKFISRANGPGDGIQRIYFPSGTAYISFQFNSTTLSDDVLNTFQVTFSDSYNNVIPTSYKPFSADGPASKLYKNARNFIRSFASDTASITGRVLANEYTERRNKLFTTIDIWEPTNVDSDYSNPTSGWGKDTKREDWAATEKYLYYDFLSHYYDTYIGIAENGYKVTKRSLGQDSANTGHELFEYDFCPVNYKYTVMLSAGMNADETQGIWGLATFIKCLMDYEEENLKLMHDNIRFKVIPIINASGFDESTLRYDYSDGVNPNFNFNYKDSWVRQTATNKGVYPDSNISTKMLKRWINENAWKADLWLDLHTGRWVIDSDTNKYIADVRVADDSMRQPFNAPYMDLIREYYTDKGYITSSDNIGGTICIRDNLDYQKTVYAYDVCGIKSVMSEMHIESTGYGADGYTNNSAEGIKCYVAQIRAMVMCYINESTQNTFVIDSIKSDAFHSRYR